MIDVFSPQKRSAIMARVKSSDTAPELRVRRLAHRLGYRFRLHRKDLPGRPDLVFPRLGVALFVHGCFWHRCPICKGASSPSSNIAYWERKFRRNVARDVEAAAALTRLGWRVEVIWECQTGGGDAELSKRLRRALSGRYRARCEMAGKRSRSA
jgi:DNA mismatch endonuclease, patch repair protein